MKQTLIINVHSSLDVITNSSTELFIISDATSTEAVKEMLEFMLEQWNKMAARGVFGDWYVQNERVSLKEGKQEYKPLKSFDGVFGEIRLLDESDLRDERGWGYEIPENIGKIIIMSACDNTIPGEMMEWIESAFSAKRFHLG